MGNNYNKKAKNTYNKIVKNSKNILNKTKHSIDKVLITNDVDKKIVKTFNKISNKTEKILVKYREQFMNNKNKLKDEVKVEYNFEHNALECEVISDTDWESLTSIKQFLASHGIIVITGRSNSFLKFFKKEEVNEVVLKNLDQLSTEDAAFTKKGVINVINAKTFFDDKILEILQNIVDKSNTSFIVVTSKTLVNPNDYPNIHFKHYR